MRWIGRHGKELLHACQLTKRRFQHESITTYLSRAISAKHDRWRVGLASLRPMNNPATRAESRGDLDCSCESFAFQDLPRRNGLRPETLRGPLHIQCDGHGDPQYLVELTTVALSWPYVETNLPNNNSSSTIPLRLEETAAGYNFAAFISPREFGCVLIGAPTIYLALPLVCAHWAIVRGWLSPTTFLLMD